jgi:hypothetical protein
MYERVPVPQAPTAGAAASLRAPAPDSPSPAVGAHRLTDYALADAAADAPIQRKVGLEFETGVPLRTTPSTKSISYGYPVTVAKDGSWQIKADSSNIEFVTAPFPETDEGEGQLTATMKAIIGWSIAMIKQRPEERRVAAVPNGGTLDTYKYEDESIVIAKDKVGLNDMLAAPQATGGVTLAQIPTLIDKLISTKLAHLKGNKRFSPEYAEPKLETYTAVFPNEDGTEEPSADALEMWQSAKETHEAIAGVVTKPLETMGYDVTDLSYSVGAGGTIVYLAMARRAVQDWEKLHYDDEDRLKNVDNAKVDGLFTLIVSYLLNGSASRAPVPYTKSAFTLMSRTNMHALYQLLTTEEKRVVTAEAIAEIAQMDLSEPLFAGGFNSRGVTVAGPTRLEWIDSVQHGTPVGVDNAPLASGADVPHDARRVAADRLSQASKTPEALNSASLGAQDVPDANPRTGKADLAVLEIRNMAKSQPIDAWQKTALAVFKMFRSLHE